MPKPRQDAAAGQQLGYEYSKEAGNIADPGPETDAFAVAVALGKIVKRYIAFLLTQLSCGKKPCQNQSAAAAYRVIDSGPYAFVVAIGRAAEHDSHADLNCRKGDCRHRRIQLPSCHQEIRGLLIFSGCIDSRADHDQEIHHTNCYNNCVSPHNFCLL